MKSLVKNEDWVRKDEIILRDYENAEILSIKKGRAYDKIKNTLKKRKLHSINEVYLIGGSVKQAGLYIDSNKEVIGVLNELYEYMSDTIKSKFIIKDEIVENDKIIIKIYYREGYVSNHKTNSSKSRKLMTTGKIRYSVFKIKESVLSYIIQATKENVFVYDDSQVRQLLRIKEKIELLEKLERFTEAKRKEKEFNNQKVLFDYEIGKRVEKLISILTPVFEKSSKDGESFEDYIDNWYKSVIENNWEKEE